MRTRLLAVTALVSIASAAASAQNIEVNRENRTIAITATDEAKSDPDVAVVHIGFEIYSPDAEAAYSQGSTLSNRILAALANAGIAEKSVESDSQSLSRYQQARPYETAEEHTQRRFVLTQSWTVKTIPANAARILHIAVQAGANSSGHIDWELQDHQQLLAQAAAKALAKARAIADQMAAGLNAHLGPLVYASNQNPNGFAFGAGGGVSGGLMADEKLPPPPLAIRPKQIEESATVYAVFAIE
jgi:uncharacterized protein YggE